MIWNEKRDGVCSHTLFEFQTANNGNDKGFGMDEDGWMGKAGMELIRDWREKREMRREEKKRETEKKKHQTKVWPMTISLSSVYTHTGKKM